jgi:hypothetical protein
MITGLVLVCSASCFRRCSLTSPGLMRLSPISSLRELYLCPRFTATPTTELLEI